MFGRTRALLSKSGGNSAPDWQEYGKKLSDAVGQYARVASKEAESLINKAKNAKSAGNADAASSSASASSSSSANGGAKSGKSSGSVMDRIRSGLDYIRTEIVDETTQARGDPYKVGKREILRKRSAVMKAKAAEPVAANNAASGLVVHKDSEWYKQWESFRESNKFVQGVFGMKMRFDESENLIVRSVRSVTERVQDGMSGEDSELLVAMKAIKAMDPMFDKEKFIVDCEQELIPGILEAFYEGDLELLKDWCTEPAFAVLSAARSAPEYAKKETKIIDVGKTDLVLAKVMENGPVLVLSTRVQVLESDLDAEGKAIVTDQDRVKAQYFVTAMTRDESSTEFGISAWRVMELGMQLEQDII